MVQSGTSVRPLPGDHSSPQHIQPGLLRLPIRQGVLCCTESMRMASGDFYV